MSSSLDRTQSQKIFQTTKGTFQPIIISNNSNNIAILSTKNQVLENKLIINSMST